jgi:hypothetical protein
MSYRRLDVVHLPLERWPFLRTSEPVPKFADLPRENIDNFFLALEAKPQSSPVLAWTGRAGCIHCSWRATTQSNSS